MANAIDRVEATPDTTHEVIVVDTLPAKFHSFTQIAFGLSQRIDEDFLINHSPMATVKLLFHLSDKTAAKVGLGYSSGNKFKSDLFNVVDYRNFKIETGFRWNIINSIISLYHENGIVYNFYYEPQTEIWEQRIGVNASMGIHFLFIKNYELDISIGQTINNGTFSPTKNFLPELSPIGLKDDRFFNELFNPLEIKVLLLKTL